MAIPATRHTTLTATAGASVARISEAAGAVGTIAPTGAEAAGAAAITGGAGAMGMAGVTDGMAVADGTVIIDWSDSGCTVLLFRSQRLPVWYWLRLRLAREISRLSQNSRFLETEISRPAIRRRADDDVVEELHLQHASAFSDSARKPEVRFAGS
jgi:hypothetical protein